MSNKGLSLSMTSLGERSYTPLMLPLSILDGLVVMIRLSHSRERGSIPRRGNTFLPLPCLLEGNAGDLRSSLFPFFFLLFPATFPLPHSLAQNSCGIFRAGRHQRRTPRCFTRALGKVHHHSTLTSDTRLDGRRTPARRRTERLSAAARQLSRAVGRPRRTSRARSPLVAVRYRRRVAGQSVDLTAERTY